MTAPARLTAHGRAAGALARLGESDLAALVAAAPGGAPPVVLPPSTARIVMRYAGLAATADTFATAFRADTSAVFAPGSRCSPGDA